MEIFSSEFLVALGAIIIIDLVLAGDNAIVIALACRNVPKHLQKRAIIWGTVGAIVVRASLTMVVVWLLQIPWLMAIGGVLLVWIAYKLLSPKEEEGEDGPKVEAATNFWGAMRTIVIADALMGLDNVLAVAGAAHGSFLLVVLGLLISIPIVIWGSTLMLRFIERYPIFVYLGAAVLAATAVRMVVSDPNVKPMLAAHPFAEPALYIVIVGAVLWSGFWRNHRMLESRIRQKLDQLGAEGATLAPGISSRVGTDAPKVLVPVDGTPNALHSARHVIDVHRHVPGMQVHLLNVQPPFSQHVGQFFTRKDIRSAQYDRAEEALRMVTSEFDRAGVPYTTEIVVGPKAEVIADTAKRIEAHHILMATARKNSLTRMLEASTTSRVLDLAEVPVQLIAGDATSRAERFVIPVALACALLVLMAIVV